jgi:ribosomal protein S18 acetylase RimI-like enzyme
MELEARGTATNIWACVSGFNTRAQQFYEKHGFERMAVLDDLVRPGFAEVLIRKRLA